jgi:short-subunit dehydrogenase
VLLVSTWGTAVKGDFIFIYLHYCYFYPGETVVVTGATSPLGKALALQAARLGHPVVGLAREGDALDALTEELEGIRSGCYTLAVDFRVPESIGRATTTMMMRTR